MTNKPIKIPGPDHPIAITPDERPGQGHRERHTRGRHPRGPDPEGGDLSRSAIHPAEGRRHDAAATDLAPDVLSLQGRAATPVFIGFAEVFTLSESRRAFSPCPARVFLSASDLLHR